MQALRAKHKKAKVKRFRPAFPDLSCQNKPEDLSNNLHTSGGFKRDKVNDHRWRKGAEEKPDTIKEIVNKSKRIRPQFNKGGYMFATDGDNEGPLTIYRK